jgi:hypothetical protein
MEGQPLLIEPIRFNGWPVARTSEAQGVSLVTAHKWLRRYDEEAGTVWWAGLPHLFGVPPALAGSKAGHPCPARDDAARPAPHRLGDR